MLNRLDRALALLAAAAGLLVVTGAFTPAVRNWMFPSANDYEMHVEDPWRYVIAGFGALPYLLAAATAVVPRERWAARCAMLAASTFLSLAVAFVSAFSFGLLFLPSTALLAAATVVALRSRPANRLEGLGTALTGPMLAMSLMFLWLLGGVAVFGGNDERCWQTTVYPDGRVVREPYDRPSGNSIGPIFPPAGASVDVTCSSDVITPSEALRSGALLLGAAALGGLALATPWARNASARV